MDCEADTPSDAKEIHPGRDMEHPDHAQDNAAIVVNEMARYNLVVLGSAKTRWTQSDKVKLASGQSIIYSGHEEEGAHHTERVDIMMTKYARKASNAWKHTQETFPELVIQINTTQHNFKFDTFPQTVIVWMSGCMQHMMHGSPLGNLFCLIYGCSHF